MYNRHFNRLVEICLLKFGVETPGCRLLGTATHGNTEATNGNTKVIHLT